MAGMTIFLKLLSQVKVPKEVLEDVVQVIETKRSATSRDVTSAIEELLGNALGGKDGHRFDIDGVPSSLYEMCSALAITGSREMATHQTVQRLLRNRTHHVCITTHPQKYRNECTLYAGQVFYIGPEVVDPEGFPRLDQIINGGPPFRPKCRHVTSPFVIAFKSKKEIAKSLEAVRRRPTWCLTRSREEVLARVKGMTEEDWACLKVPRV